MQIHQIQPKHLPIKSRRRGRGGKRGTYSGKGMKGQKSRAGSKIKPQAREALLKFPKRRGVKFKRVPRNLVIVNINTIQAAFPQGGTITPKKLKNQGFISKSSKSVSLKLIGKGEIKNPYIIKGMLVSKTVKVLIEKSGGKIITINKNKKQIDGK